MNITVIVALLIMVLMLGVGGLLTEIGDWYRNLRKPSWNPPNWLFAPAWTIILALATWSGVIAWAHAPDAATRVELGVTLGSTVVLHILWSPLFFKLKRPDLSLIEIPFLWLSILASIIVELPISAQAAWLLSPYLAWVTFATGLNAAIVRLNPRTLA